MGQSLAESRDLQALAVDLQRLASLLAEGSETASRAHLPDRALAAELLQVCDNFGLARAELSRQAESAGESAESVLAITSIEELQATAQRLAERRSRQALQAEVVDLLDAVLGFQTDDPQALPALQALQATLRIERDEFAKGTAERAMLEAWLDSAHPIRALHALVQDGELSADDHRTACKAVSERFDFDLSYAVQHHRIKPGGGPAPESPEPDSDPPGSTAEPPRATPASTANRRDQPKGSAKGGKSLANFEEARAQLPREMTALLGESPSKTAGVPPLRPHAERRPQVKLPKASTPARTAKAVRAEAPGDAASEAAPPSSTAETDDAAPEPERDPSPAAVHQPAATEAAEPPKTPTTDVETAAEPPIALTAGRPAPPPSRSSSADKASTAAVTDDAWADCQRLAAAMSSDADQVEELVWLLLRADRFGLAALLASAREVLWPGLGVPTWLLQAVGLTRGDGLLSPAAGHTLLEAFCQFQPELLFEPGSAADNHARRLLCSAAALPAALLSGGSAAATVLRGLEAHGDLDATEALWRAAAQFHEYGGVFDEPLLGMLSETLTAQEAIRACSSAARELLAKARQGHGINYHAGGSVLRRLAEPGNALAKLLTPVAEEQASQVDRVRQLIDELGDAGRRDQAIREADQDLRGPTAGIKPIVGTALSMLRERIARGLELAKQWAAMAGEPIGVGGGLQPQLEALRQALARGAEIRTEGEALVADYAGHHRLQTAVRLHLDAAQLAAGVVQTASRAALPSAGALDRDLMMLPGIAWQDGAPVYPGTETDAALVVSAVRDWVAAGGQPVRQAHEHCCDVGDHSASERLIAVARSDDDEALRSELEGLRERSIDHWRRGLRSRSESLLQKLDEALALRALGDHQAARLEAEIDRLERRLSDPEWLRFDRDSAGLAVVEAEVDDCLQARREALARDLDALTMSDQARAEVLELLRDDDLIAVDESLALARSGSLRAPCSSSEIGPFESFFPHWLETLEAALTDEATASMYAGNQPLVALREGRDLGPLAYGRLTATERLEAASWLEAWFALDQAKPQPEAMGRLLEGIGLLPGTLDLGPEAVDGLVLGALHSAVLNSAEICPVPQYGSLANGRYGLLVARRRVSVGSLIAAAGNQRSGAPQIAFSLRRLWVRDRLDLSRQALNHTGAQAMLLLDEALALYLSTLPTNQRASAFFHCALPFTNARPYVESSQTPLPPELFVGRRGERQRLVDLSASGSALVYGGRQVGKTALLREVVRQAEANGLHSIYRDIRNYGGSEHPDDLWRVLREWFAQLPDWPQTSSNIGPRLLMERLVEWLRADVNRQVLVVLDEADRFLESEMVEDYPRTVLLRQAMREAEGRFKVVFAGLHNVQRVARRANSPLLHMGQPICVGPLFTTGETQEARYLVQRPLAALGYLVPPSVALHILSQTHYYPHFIQIMCGHLLDHLRQKQRHALTPVLPYRVSLADVQEVEHGQDLLQVYRDRLKQTLELDQRYRVIANALAFQTLNTTESVADIDIKTARTDCQQYAPALFAGCDPDQMSVLLDELVGMGLLRGEQGRYQLRSSVVLRLLGAADEVAQQLDSARLLRPPTSPPWEHLHRVIENEPCPVANGVVETLLSRRGHGVGVVFGTPIGGVGRLAAALRPKHHRAVGPEHVLDRADQAHLREQLRKLASGRGQREAELNLLVVAPQVAWTPDWVEDTLHFLRGLSGSGPVVRVVFVGGSAHAWQWVTSDAFDRSPGDSVEVRGLRPWRPEAAAHWLAELDHDMVTGEEERLLAADWMQSSTGLWDRAVLAYGQMFAADPARWDRLAEAMSCNGTAQEDFGIPDAALSALRAWASPILTSPGTQDPAVLWALAVGVAEETSQGLELDPSLRLRLDAQQ